MRVLFTTTTAIAALAAPAAHATGSLSFEAKGYLLDFVVGDASGPSISGLNFAGPGSTQATPLPMAQVVVEAFDPQQKILLLRFRNPGDARQPESFYLTVKDGVGTLKVGKKQKALVGSFSWGM